MKTLPRDWPCWRRSCGRSCLGQLRPDRMGGRLCRAERGCLTGQSEAVVWLSWAASVQTSVGLAGVVVAWLAGLALLLVAPALVGRLARRMR